MRVASREWGAGGGVGAVPGRPPVIYHPEPKVYVRERPSRGCHPGYPRHEHTAQITYLCARPKRFSLLDPPAFEFCLFSTVPLARTCPALRPRSHRPPPPLGPSPSTCRSPPPIISRTPAHHDRARDSLAMSGPLPAETRPLLTRHNSRDTALHVPGRIRAPHRIRQ